MLEVETDREWADPGTDALKDLTCARDDRLEPVAWSPNAKEPTAVPKWVFSGDGVQCVDPVIPGMQEIGENMEAGRDEAEAGDCMSALSSGLSPR